VAAPLVYVARTLDPADRFDLALIVRTPELSLAAVCADDALLGLSDAVGRPIPTCPFAEALERAQEPVTVIAVDGFDTVHRVQRAAPERFRERVARMFLVGGHANDYRLGRAGEFLPIDPRLRERNPERFAADGDPRLRERTALDALLLCGEGVIWLPRDICLWRYAAAQILEDDAADDPLVAWLLDRLEGEAPVLLSTPPALCLARLPDPLPWLRLFRTAAVRLAPRDGGAVGVAETAPDRPNAFAVTAIDGGALGRLVTATLRGDSRARIG
jgi:hypothetical protein